MASVVIVEDHALLAQTLRAALNSRGIVAEIAAPAHPTRLTEHLLDLDPVLVQLDLDLGEHGDSTAVIAPLAAVGIRSLVVSGTTDRERIALAFEAGAVGFHAKSGDFDALVAKTVAALRCDEPLDDPLRRSLQAELARTRVERSAALAPFLRLTERESATLAELGTGLSVREIATGWVVSEATVRSHVRSVLAKLGVPSQLAAVALAIRSGWLSGGRASTRSAAPVRQPSA
jgi:DNA-binding NarL/FixJ family response regulator